MNSPNWEAILDRIDDELLQEAISTYGQRGSASDRKEKIMNKRTLRPVSRTALIAAVLAMILAIGALAVGYSIHAQRQQELRQELRIDSANVTTYVEYETPETAEPGVTLLSAVRDGEWQTVYLNVSPVEREDVAAFANGINFNWSIDGVRWGAATPRLSAQRTNLGPDELGAAALEDAYDAASKTLTLSCVIWTERLEEMGGPVELRLVREDAETGETAPLGSVMFTPTDAELRSISFVGGTVTDAETGLTVTVERLDLSPLSATWYISWDHAQSDEMAQPGLEDRFCQSAVLHFTDGSSLTTVGPLSGTGESGLYCSWRTAVDIHALESVTIGDTVLTIDQ